MEEKEKTGKQPLAIVRDDPWLAPYAQYLENRLEWYHKHLRFIEEHCNGLGYFATATSGSITTRRKKAGGFVNTPPRRNR